MIDWEEVLEQLNEMCLYFEPCVLNAGLGTRAEALYRGYIKTLETVMESIREMLAEDNDGR